MKKAFETLRITREKFLAIIEGHSLATLNEIPVGFNNNLIWNFGHALATTQLLVYGPAGLTPPAEPALVEKYRRGTKPEGKVNAAELSQLKELATASVTRLEADFSAGKFAQWEPYKTGYGLLLETPEEALRFVSLHEAMHMGYAMAIRRSLG